MTNNNVRIFLWIALGLAVWLNYQQWQMDYGPKPSTANAAASAGATKTSLDDTVPRAAQPNQQPTTTSGAPQTPAPAATAPEQAAPAGRVHVTTDVLVLDVDLRGGTLVHAELPGYPLVKGQPAPVVLFNEDSPETNYVLRTGLSSPAAGVAMPNHLALLTSASGSYELAAGQDELRVPLTWSSNGVTVAKTYVFHRGSFAIGVEYSIQNQTAAPWTAASYAQISRSDPKMERSMFKVESFAFRGPAIFDPNGKKYQRLNIEKTENQRLSLPVKDGWLAGMQHHFVSAIVPEKGETYTYSLQVEDRHYLLGALGPTVTVAPGATTVMKEQLFVGPKLQKQLVTLHPELDRVADYSWATFIARPLFWLLQSVHGLVQNWGFAIIIVTFLLKALFYPLAQYSGKSMARMRTLTPRIKALQESYKDDREKLGRAMMDLYKTERVNPVSGCLPMLIQMPVFLAFYWVLLESVEMRQAPFLGWINDLSARDPFFILPALNGLAMWFQYKLNPPPPDPMQAKVFQFMPLVFSVMFALFPAGLVLYWVTNTGLSILQQWNINRHIAADEKRRKA